jgi:homoaconitase/3-isopropylmalate dehydratase large subunit
MVAAGTRLIVAPASLQDQDSAEREGVMQVLRDAGAQVAPPPAAPAPATATRWATRNVISSTARNFRGRMGSPPPTSTWRRRSPWRPRPLSRPHLRSARGAARHGSPA